TSIFAVLAVLGGILSFHRIVTERDLAQRAQDAAERQTDSLVLLQAQQALDRDPAATLAWLKRLRPQAGGWGKARALISSALSSGVARSAAPQYRVNWVEPAPDGSKAFVCCGGPIGIVGVPDLRVQRHWNHWSNRIGRIAWSHDGTRVVAAGSTGEPS